MALGSQLRLYKAPSVRENDGDEENEVGFLESSTPPIVNKNQERFRPKRAAVLICLFEGDTGEVSLPGGKAEGDKDDIETATREAKEEIGLDPYLSTSSQCLIHSCLSFSSLQHLLRVVPVIGLLPDKNAFTPLPNAAEVEAVFDVPLERFIKDENRRSEEKEWLGDKYLIHYFDYETDKKKYIIWGLTAGILIRAASVGLLSSSSLSSTSFSIYA